jgi:hypothetical protein
LPWSGVVGAGGGAEVVAVGGGSRVTAGAPVAGLVEGRDANDGGRAIVAVGGGAGALDAIAIGAAADVVVVKAEAGGGAVPRSDCAVAAEAGAPRRTSARTPNAVPSARAPAARNDKM